MCQINTVVGDLDGNVDRILTALSTASDAGADVAVFPELTLTGYPPEDLLLKGGFVAANQQALHRLASEVRGTAAVVGFVDGRRDLYNAAAILHRGEVMGVAHKRLLPNYDVFDDKRYFRPGDHPHQLFAVAGVRVGLSICEDAWSNTGPIYDLAEGGAEVILNLNASPYRRGKQPLRESLIQTRATDSGCWIVYVNSVGGQDELVYDGGSIIADDEGNIVARARQFTEHVLVMDMTLSSAQPRRLGPRSGEDLPVVEITGPRLRPEPSAHRGVLTDTMSPLREIWEALVLGTHDYVTKNGFSEVVIGLSGGIDSSIVAAIAADALGPEHVHGVLMPSRYSSDHSVSDAERLCANLGIDHRIVPIEPAHAAFTDMLAESFADRTPDLTDQNLQSRIRGVTLMALSNEFGWLVLTTGNKSESAVGYSTLYGDTAGGYAVIKDVPKTDVYRLCSWRNHQEGRELIPENVITKPPSAELRPGQRDDQSLPPYDVLDPIIEGYVDHDLTATELIEAGHDEDVVRRVVRLIDIAEYKRRQNPIGVRISSKAFGRDRRLPITNGFRG